MRGRSQAMLATVSLATFSLLFMPLGILSAASIGLVTLMHGILEGLILLLMASLGCAVLAWVSLNEPILALAFMLEYWLPVWILSVVLRVNKDLGKTFQMAGFLATVGIILFYWVVGNPSDWWLQLLTTKVLPSLGETGRVLLSQEENLQLVAGFMTEMVAAMLTLTLLMAVLVARWWQSVLVCPEGFAKDFSALNMGYKLAVLMPVLLAITVLAEGLPAMMASDILVVLSVLFGFQGFSLLQGSMNSYNLSFRWRVFVYSILFFIPQMLVLIVSVGILDAWFNVKKRLGQ